MGPDFTLRRAEFILTGCGILGFVTLLIRITTIYSGLPAHPLFVHVPVVLIPASVLGALVCVACPRMFDRFGIWLCAVAIVAMSAIFLTMQAGGALEDRLHLQGRAASLIDQHSHAADILAIVFIAFTAVLILSFAAHRIGGGMPVGVGLVDGILGAEAVRVLLRVGLLALALVAAYFVFRVGDLGAKAVWMGRLQQAG